MTTLKKLPLGIESFTKIIDENLLYADKTKYIYDLLRSKDRNYFLARPKKFGKTLLINTLETLFSGERERFRGLWLDRSDYDFSKHPVISLSMQAEAKGPKILEANLLYSLRAIAKTNTLDIEVTRPSLYFRALIKALHDSFNSKVAVLIDEYDGSVTGNLRNQELALANAKVLNSFYGALKQAADYVHVTFVTGVSRYALTFIDLEPDYLKDITLESKYTGLCGLTIEEFDDLFAERFHCALEAMKAKGVIKPTCQVGDFRKDIISGYGGYNWGDERGVLNPHSLLHFFDELAFEHFWSRSKMPSHLTALIETRLGDITEPKLKSYVSTPISQTALTELSIPSALFHLGYLTIDKVFDKVLVGAEDGSQDSHEDSYEDGHIETYYSLKHPNLETSTSYRHYFNITIRDIQEQFYNNKKNDLLKAFLDRDAQTVSSILRDYVFSVGFRQTIYDQSQKTYDDEISLHHLLMWLFIILGFDTAFVDIPLITEPFVLGFERDQVYLIIKFKYYPMNYRILNNNEINIINELLLKRYSYKLINRFLNIEVRNLMSPSDFEKPLPEPLVINLTDAENEELAVEAFRKSLPPDSLNRFFHKLAIEKLNETQIAKALEKASASEIGPKEDIDDILSNAAKEALNDITKGNYHDRVKENAIKIIDLGLVIYGSGQKIQAQFG